MPGSAEPPPPSGRLSLRTCDACRKPTLELVVRALGVDVEQLVCRSCGAMFELAPYGWAVELTGMIASLREPDFAMRTAAAQRLFEIAVDARAVSAIGELLTERRSVALDWLPTRHRMRGSRKGAVAEVAAAILVQIGAPAVEVLEPALASDVAFEVDFDNGDPYVADSGQKLQIAEVASNALLAIAVDGGEGAALERALHRIVMASSAKAKASVIDQLLRSETVATTALAAALDASVVANAKLRLRIATELEGIQFRPPAVIIPALGRALRDESVDVRAAAAWSIRRFRTEEAAAYADDLRVLLGDERTEWNAALALVRLGCPCETSIQVLTRVAVECSQPTVSARINGRERIAREQKASLALGALRDAGAAAASSIDAIVGIVTGNNERHREQAGYVLVAIGKAAKPALLELVGNGVVAVRCLAARSLGALADSTVAPALRALATDPDKGVRREAIVALVRVREMDDAATTIIPTLLEMLEDDDVIERGRAADMLAIVGDGYANVAAALSKALQRASDDAYKADCAGDRRGELAAAHAWKAINQAIETMKR